LAAITTGEFFPDQASYAFGSANTPSSPCQGSKDKNGKNFEDYVSPDLRAILTTQYIVDGTTQPVGPGQILGGENGQVTRRGKRDFFGMW
jgi:hypothetical protein